MKRQANPPLSTSGECALAQYEQALREQEDLTPASLRNYLSDLRHFIAWYEACPAECAPDTLVNSWFDLSAITTPTLTRYRTSLQTVQRQKPASVNRSLVSFRLAQIMGHDSLDTTTLSIQGTKHDVQQAVETIAWT
jgi:integrase/recombinase XerC